MNEENKERHEGGTPVLTTRRILLTVAALAVVALLLGRWLYHEPIGSKTVPPRLIGLWTSDVPEYSDRYLELKPTTITFGTGGTSSVRYTILNVVHDRVNGQDVFTVNFRDMGGTKYSREIVIEPETGRLYFASQMKVPWSRFRQ